MPVGIHAGQKRVLDLLELDLQVAGNHLMSVLGTELRSWKTNKSS